MSDVWQELTIRDTAAAEAVIDQALWLVLQPCSSRLKNRFAAAAFRRPRDVYKPENWQDDALFRPEVREVFPRLVAQGWTDALRRLHPNDRIYTFWDYFRKAHARNAGVRIDHLLLAPSIAGHLKAAGVDREVRGWERTSDHAPTWIELTDESHRPKPTARRKPRHE